MYPFRDSVGRNLLSSNVVAKVSLGVVIHLQAEARKECGRKHRIF
jgi:hypothetical protein